MDSRRRGKRKSPSADIIFEVSDNDISSENSEDECNEPEAKISKLESKSFTLMRNEFSNLNDDSETTVEITLTQEQEDSIEISEHISVSNSSNCNSNSSHDGSDVIVISEDNIDVVNDSEENYAEPLPQAESVEEHSEDNSADSCEIIVITDEHPDCSDEQASISQPEENLVSNANENLVSSSDDNILCVNDETVKNLEEGELGDSQIEVEEEEPIIDVVTSSPITVENEQVADELDNAKSDPCSISINFSDEKMANLYKFKFLKFLKQFVELEVESCDDLTIKLQRDPDLDANEWIVLDETMSITETEEIKVAEKVELPLLIAQEKSPKKKKRKKNKKDKDLFILDTNPSQNDNGAQHTKYSTKFQIDTSDKSAAEEGIVKMSSQTCFNCGSNHAIKDCPLPKDFSKINAARQRFKAQKQTSRYHLEEDQKYSHLVPGKMSDKLREALGLRKNQLPPFIYHMRMLGYPPGWLEEAKFVHSNLAMFDSDGNNVQNNLKKNRGLDTEKIVDYPGFNVPIEKNMKDEYRHFGVPPYSDQFSKQAMIEYFEKHFTSGQDDFEACDMDLDSTFEEKEKTTALQTTEETILPNRLLNELKEVDLSMSSPSLVDLEKQKENLLAALEENNSSSNPKSVDTTCDDAENSSDQDKAKANDKVPIDKELEINIEKTEDTSICCVSPTLNSSVNSVKTSMFGTPILKSSSPYSRLPNPDNFMKDVSPVINFENLPNSTGKYEQMTGVLRKVRNTLKGLQNCKS